MKCRNNSLAVLAGFVAAVLAASSQAVAQAGSPALRYAEASGCGGLFLYAWNDNRSEVLTIRADRSAVPLPDGTTTLNLATAVEGVAVRVEMTEASRGNLPFCSDDGAPTGERPVVWTAVAGEVKLLLKRRPGASFVPVNVAIERLVLQGPHWRGGETAARDPLHGRRRGLGSMKRARHQPVDKKEGKMTRGRILLGTCGAVCLASVAVLAQAPGQPDWTRLQDETMLHYQTLLRFDTSDPPGREQPASDYLMQVFQKEGIPAQTFALEGHRPNVVARLKGNGRKKPLLIMAHTDVVNVDPAKWTHPPFSATREGGFVYGRGTIDDKDNVTAGLMAMLLLKRLSVPLDRDVIFLAEAGEEGTTRVGIEYMVAQHFGDIEAEYCLAEGGGVSRVNGQVKYATVQTTEKIPRAIEITANGTSGHGSIPLKDNAIVRLAAAVASVGRWRPPVRLNETTGAYFKRLADISSPEDAARYRALLSLDPKVVAAADDYMFEHEPRHSSMLRTSASPNIFTGGYRVNVIPSEAKAIIDVRVLPDEEPEKFLQAVRNIVDDATLDVHWAQRDVRPGADTANLSSEGFKAIEAATQREYSAVTLPTMSTGATDMAYLRAKGVQCYGIGPATDVEDGPKGFGAHSDQERLLESELHRFTRFTWDVVTALARSGGR